jgi:hypothetical protein
MMTEAEAIGLLVRHGKAGDVKVGKIAAICVTDLMNNTTLIQGYPDRFEYAINWLCPQMERVLLGTSLKAEARNMAKAAAEFAEATMTFDGQYKRDPDGAQ